MKIGYRQYTSNAYYLIVQLPDNTVHQVGTVCLSKQELEDKLGKCGVQITTLVDQKNGTYL